MKVFVYFNLHKKVWSVKALEGEMKGRVIAHCNRIVLKDCELKVSKAGRERVIREKKKYVHAGVVGNIVSMDETFNQEGTQITYNPYKYTSFVNKETLEPVLTSNVAFMTANRGEPTSVFIK